MFIAASAVKFNCFLYDRWFSQTVEKLPSIVFLRLPHVFCCCLWDVVVSGGGEFVVVVCGDFVVDGFIGFAAAVFGDFVDVGFVRFVVAVFGDFVVGLVRLVGLVVILVVAVGFVRLVVVGVVVGFVVVAAAAVLLLPIVCDVTAYSRKHGKLGYARVQNRVCEESCNSFSLAAMVPFGRNDAKHW